MNRNILIIEHKYKLRIQIYLLLHTNINIEYKYNIKTIEYCNEWLAIGADAIHVEGVQNT
jgi:hypothetical protein